MKITNRLMSLSLAAAALMAVSSCKNSDIEFPDNTTKTVYFGNQYPVRTLVMGEDNDVDLTLDNKWQCKIGATFGGSYTGKDYSVTVDVDETLLENLYLDAAATVPVKALDPSYYTITKTANFGGSFYGYFDVQLNEKFFEDPNTAAVLDDKGTMIYPNGLYVIPLVITSQNGADAILSGQYDTDVFPSAPARTKTDDWKVAPKDFTLYAVNYINEQSGFWLQSGTDVVNGTTVDRTVKNEFVIEDKVVYLSTVNLKKVKMKTPEYTYDVSLPAESVEIELTFADNGDVTVSAPDGAAYTVSGTGKYTKKGAGKYWGNKDRDLITLEYTVKSGANTYKTSDKLVSQRRGIKFNEFAPNYISSK